MLPYAAGRRSAGHWSKRWAAALLGRFHHGEPALSARFIIRAIKSLFALPTRSLTVLPRRAVQATYAASTEEWVRSTIETLRTVRSRPTVNLYEAAGQHQAYTTG